MSRPRTAAPTGPLPGRDTAHYYKKEFWSRENPKYEDPHFRLLKCARLVNRLAGDRERTLLDVGCGPATLARFLLPSIRYHGIDISIAHPAPHLREADILTAAVDFDGQRFDLVVAQGLFEYLGDAQTGKLAEIRDVLEPGGRFVVSYVNFDHRRPILYWPYNNVRPSGAFADCLSAWFTVERVVPTAHNWNHTEPRRRLVRTLNLHLDTRVPVVTPKLAVEYLYVCRSKP